MSFPDDALERLIGEHDRGWRGDWDDVRRRTTLTRRKRPRIKRRVVFAVAAVVAVLVPLTAVAAADGWWFFKFGATPKPVQAPVVVKHGVWEGTSWQLVAYPSTTDGLCFGMTEAEGDRGALGCAAIVGVPRTAETKGSPDMPITFLSADNGDGGLPRYIVGPVIASAQEVVIAFENGQRLRVPASPAPPPLTQLRFYATPLPADQTPASPPRWIAGLDRNGNVVACLNPTTAIEGISSPSDCPADT